MEIQEDKSVDHHHHHHHHHNHNHSPQPPPQQQDNNVKSPIQNVKFPVKLESCKKVKKDKKDRTKKKDKTKGKEKNKQLTSPTDSKCKEKEEKEKKDRIAKMMSNKNIEGIKQFLAEAEDVNMPIDSQNNTLLHIACIDCQSLPPTIIESILKTPHVSVNLPNNSHNTPLHYLCVKWQIPDLKVFDDFFSLGASVNAVNSANESPLMKAILNRSLRKPIVKKLLDKGANPNQLNSHQEGILHYVARQGNEDILRLILTKCDGESLQRKGREGLTPREIAKAERAKQREPEIVNQYQRIYQTLTNVEELDEFLNEMELTERREFFIEEGLDLNELSSWTEDQLDTLPLPLGTRRKLKSGLSEHKRKNKGDSLDLHGSLGIESFFRLQTQQIDEGKIETFRQELMTGGTEVPFIDYDQLEFLDELGRGASSAVWKGKLRKKGEDRGILEVALKIIVNISSELLEEFKREILLLHSVNHPNVVKLFGVTLKPNLILVMEYCSEGSLHHILSSDRFIGWKEFFSISLQAVEGLKALHTHSPKILHRDIKPLNLLMNKEWQVKVADFGLSLQDNAKSDNLKEQRGTTSYMPPELFYSTKYSSQSDIYSLGIVFWELIYRVIHQKHMKPFAEYSFSGPLLIIIAAAKENKRPTIPPNTPAVLRHLFEYCTKSLPTDRPECDQVIEILKQANLLWTENQSEWDGLVAKNNS